MIRNEKWRNMRKAAYKESTLPCSFSYKIKNAFIGEPCPICGVSMGVAIREDDDPIIVKTPLPTIQHNMPISLGGKHELSNISVICHRCNVTIKNRPTGELNNWLVVKKWKQING